ncbi:MAG: C39 family peptidase [Syntrophales bacterium]
MKFEKYLSVLLVVIFSVLIVGCSDSEQCCCSDNDKNPDKDTGAPTEQAEGIALDVPYLRQLDIPVIGEAACASASTAMILAYYGKIKNDQESMIEAAETVFNATSSTTSGLNGRDILEDHLEQVWGFSSVYFNDSYWDVLYETVKSEIGSGRPLILGSRSMTSYGHYIVVIGYEGDSYQSGKVIVNDPYGRWNAYNSYSTKVSGAGLRYNFTDITDTLSDGVFVIIP